MAEQQAAAAVAGDATIAAIGVGGQQHGMVALDADDRSVHPAKLWNDTESAPDADWLIKQFGGGDAGRAAWVAAVGSVPVASLTVTKLSWLHRSHPDAWARIAHIVLPHDYVTFKMTGRFTTDRGDASGTGYWSPATGAYVDEVLALIDAGSRLERGPPRGRRTVRTGRHVPWRPSSHRAPATTWRRRSVSVCAPVTP